MLFLIHYLLNKTYLAFLFSFMTYTLIFLLILFIYLFKTSKTFRRSAIIGISTAVTTTILIVLFKYLINYLDETILLSNSEEIGISFIFSITLVRIFIKNIITIIVDNNSDLMTINTKYGVDINEYKKPTLYHINTSNADQDFNTQKPNPEFDAMEALRHIAESLPPPNIPELTPEDLTEPGIKKIWRDMLEKGYEPTGDVPPETNGSFNFRNKIMLIYSKGTVNNVNRIHLSGIMFDPYTENEIKKGYNKNNYAANQPSAKIMAELFEYLFINNKKFLGRDLLRNYPDIKKYVKDCSPSNIADDLQTGHISKELINRLRRS